MGLVAAELSALVPDVNVSQPSGIDAMRAVVRQAAADGRRVVVAGGDGSVHQAVNALADWGADTGETPTLGIVAAGTGNDFAGALGLPALGAPGLGVPAVGGGSRWSMSRFAARAAHAAMAPPRACDLLRVTEPDGTHRHWAASHVTCGFPVEVNDRSASVRFPPGGLKYTAATIAMAWRTAVRDYRVVVDGEAHELAAFLLVVANTFRFGAGVRIAPNADAHDGVADLVAASELSAAKVLRLLPVTRAGKHLDHPAVTSLRGRTFELSVASAAVDHAADAAGAAGADVVAPLQGDGEPLGALPCVVTTVPAALGIAGANPS